MEVGENIINQIKTLNTESSSNSQQKDDINKNYEHN